jgi:hypothetical protein
MAPQLDGDGASAGAGLSGGRTEVFRLTRPAECPLRTGQLPCGCRQPLLRVRQLAFRPRAKRHQADPAHCHRSAQQSGRPPNAELAMSGGAMAAPGQVVALRSMPGKGHDHDRRRGTGRGPGTPVPRQQVSHPDPVGAAMPGPGTAIGTGSSPRAERFWLVPSQEHDGKHDNHDDNDCSDADIHGVAPFSLRRLAGRNCLTGHSGTARWPDDLLRVAG